MNKNTAKNTAALEQVSRNWVKQAANGRKSAGAMRDRRNRRPNDARKSWKNEQY